MAKIVNVQEVSLKSLKPYKNEVIINGNTNLVFMDGKRGPLTISSLLEIYQRFSKVIVIMMIGQKKI